LGDSRATLDCGGLLHQLTADHRVATHALERRRLEAAGAIIAPIHWSGASPKKLQRPTARVGWVSLGV
jgi:serine/threonine protein phosphatase PrpC